MTIQMAVLGDSIAAGQGATRTADSLASRLTAGLADHGVEAAPRIFAASGARSSALRGQVDRALEWQPDLAVIVIGANDLSHLTPPAQAAAALGEAVRRLRDAGALVVVAPAPDLSVVPYVPAGMRPIVRAASQTLRDLQSAQVVAAGGRVADREGRTTSAFAADRALFSADLFHPSSAGYAVIAGTLLPEILEALRTRTEP
jgi:lysophospholipase L1-like esterase